MTEEQINSLLSLLERIALALEAVAPKQKPSGGPDRPAGRNSIIRLVEEKSSEKVGIFADTMIEQLNTPGGSTKERWQKARDAVVSKTI